MYLFQRQSSTERRRQRQRSSIHCFTPQMSALAGARPFWSQDLLHFPHWYRGPKTWAIFLCLPKYISRELDQTWRNQDSKWLPYGMLVWSWRLNLLYSTLAVLKFRSFSSLYFRTLLSSIVTRHCAESHSNVSSVTNFRASSAMLFFHLPPFAAEDLKLGILVCLATLLMCRLSRLLV